VEGSIKIQVNGEQRAIPVGMTVGQLLRDLQIGPERVAIELNLQIIDRREFDQRMLQEGDRVEIISFIGGGSGEFVDFLIW
jgi:thiamine biosynthesis protein ThiS